MDKLSEMMTPQQAKAINALDWLYDDSISSMRSGRSTAIGAAILRAIVRNPGREILLFDHYPSYRRERDMMADIILGLAKEIALPGQVQYLTLSGRIRYIEEKNPENCSLKTP